MKPIHQYLQRFASGNFATRYPEYNAGDGKTHVLYLPTELNEVALYRTILPCLEINNTQTHSALMYGFYSRGAYSGYTDAMATMGQHEKTAILQKLVPWAHIIVFPTTPDDLRQHINQLRNLNPNVKFYMDIDDNVHKLLGYHPAHRVYSDKMKAWITHNMTVVDAVTVATQPLADFYGNYVFRAYRRHAKMIMMPNLISAEMDIPSPQTRTIQTGKTRIGMVVTPNHYMDVKALREPLSKIKTPHEIIMFGWNGRLSGWTDALRNIKFTHIPHVPFLSYFEKLNSLELDLAIIPVMQQREFNIYKSPQRFFELSALKIPCIIGDCEVYNLADGPYSYTVPNSAAWLETITRAMEQVEQRKYIAEMAHLHVWEHYSYNIKNLEYLTGHVYAI